MPGRGRKRGDAYGILLELLDGAGGGYMLRSELVQASGVPESTVTSALASLVRDGHISRGTGQPVAFRRVVPADAFPEPEGGTLQQALQIARDILRLEEELGRLLK